MTNDADPALFRSVQKNYMWFAIGFFMPIFTLWGAYQLFMTRSATQGTWLQSHTDFQVRYISVVVGLVALGLILHSFSLIGLLIFAALWVWYTFRLARGWSALGYGEEADAGWI